MKEDKTEFNILLVSDIHNQKLEKLCDKVIYIPGNHDTSNMVSDTPPALTEKSTNNFINPQWTFFI